MVKPNWQTMWLGSLTVVLLIVVVVVGLRDVRRQSQAIEPVLAIPQMLQPDPAVEAWFEAERARIEADHAADVEDARRTFAAIREMHGMGERLEDMDAAGLDEVAKRLEELDREQSKRLRAQRNRNRHNRLKTETNDGGE